MLTCAASRALQAKRAQCTFGTLSLATIQNNQKKQPTRHKAFWANERARSEFPSQTILRRKLIAVGAPRLNGLRQSGGRDDVGTADKQQTRWRLFRRNFTPAFTAKCHRFTPTVTKIRYTNCFCSPAGFWGITGRQNKSKKTKPAARNVSDGRCKSKLCFPGSWGGN